MLLPSLFRGRAVARPTTSPGGLSFVGLAGLCPCPAVFFARPVAATTGGPGFQHPVPNKVHHGMFPFYYFLCIRTHRFTLAGQLFISSSSDREHR
jgi:hypothetical protein